MSEPGEITRLLEQAHAGDRDASNQLFLLVQDDLRRIAHNRRRNASADLDCTTTMLIDDAFMKLVHKEKAKSWTSADRTQFFGFAATKIQSIFFDAVRKQKAKKRGGAHERVNVEIADLADPNGWNWEDPDFQLEVRKALDELEKFAVLDAAVFRLRFFMGISFEDIADIMKISISEAEKAYNAAWAWLRRKLQKFLQDG